MNIFDILQIVISFVVLVLLAPMLGNYFKKVYEGESHLFGKIFGKLEYTISSLLGDSYSLEMTWKDYFKALMVFSGVGFIFVFFIQIFQNILSLNPQQLPGVSWHLAFNTAISFVTNTNWQAYAGENTMSTFTQMVALTVQNFLSAATGMAVAVALARGFSRSHSEVIGNFWKDLTRGVLYILLPLSILVCFLLMNEGVIQNFHRALEVTTLEGVKQIIPFGPVASQVAIKQLGTNGGGFFNANSAYPFENPTPFSNWIQLISILLIPVGFPFLFGNLVKNKKHGLTLFLTMFVLLVISFTFSLYFEVLKNPNLMEIFALEGKETRFGITNSILWSTFTTAASNGSVNAMHSSLSPLAGGLAMFNMMLGEIIFGGVGSGVYGMILFVFMTVFLAGLMVGRTPEYLGKKVEAREIQMTIIGILLPSVAVLLGAGISLVLPIGLSSLSSKGPHGLSEILYAFTSTGNNNGSAFAGLNANTIYYNLIFGITMLMGRFGVIYPVLAIAGSLAKKKISPPSQGTFTTDNILFIVLLLTVILIVGGLTFLPSLSLGPIIEHFLMQSGRTF